MDKNCIICAETETNPENDIRQRKIEGEPVFLMIEGLFGLRIDAADRREKALPHKICPSCIEDLTTAYNLRSDLETMEEVIAKREMSVEPSLSKMEKNCVICSTIEENPASDIKHRKIEGKPVFLVLEEIFRLGIDAADRCERGLPHRICPTCVEDLTTAYNLKCDLWQMEEIVAEWKIKCEGNEVYSTDVPHTLKVEEGAFIEYPIDIKEETILDLNIDPSTSQNYQDVQNSPVLRVCEAKTECHDEPKTEVLLEFQVDIKEETIVDSASELNASDDDKPVPKLVPARFSCTFPDCKASLKTKVGLGHHILYVHHRGKRESTAGTNPEGADDRFPCDICGKKFKHKMCVAQHMIYVHTNKWYDCKKCPKRFKGARDLERHQVVHVDDRKFLCDICGHTAKSRNHIRQHMSRVHLKGRNTSGSLGTKSGQSANMFTCDICRKLYPVKDSLRQHLQNVHFKLRLQLEQNMPAKKEFSCEICDRRFSCRRNLKSHLLNVHINEGPHECTTCHKRFKRVRSLKSHLLYVHTKKEPYNCTICQKKYKYKQKLKIHLLRAHNQTCDKAVESHQKDIQKHAIHVKDGKFSCDMCGKRFKSKSRIAYHIKYTHSTAQISCDFCNKLFKCKEYLRKHKNKVHRDDVYRFKCEVCQKFCKTQAYLNFHKILHMKDK